MCEWYHRTLAGGTLALDAPLMLYVIRRFLRQVESRAVGGDVCALRDAMVELVAGYEWRTSIKSSEEMLLEDRKFSATRQGWSKGIGGCDDSMKLCLSSSGRKTRLAKGEPAQAGSKPCLSVQWARRGTYPAGCSTMARTKRTIQ